MAIHRVTLDGDVRYVISSHQVALPGNYDSARTARYAFQFPDPVLARLMEEHNYQGAPITLEILRAARRQRAAP